VKDRATRSLIAGGMTRGGASLMASAFADAAAVWTRFGSRRQRYLTFVPGRIEVLGKHTDYAGGATLTCAVERGFATVYSPRADNVLQIVDAAGGPPLSFAIDAAIEPPLDHWSNYPMTVARRIARNFHAPLVGADIAFKSTLPRAAGLSSSSALITAMFLVLKRVNRLASHPAYTSAIANREDLAGYLGSVENGQPFGTLTGDTGVGTFGGSEDHTAILCSQAGHIGHFAFCPVERRAMVPMPQGWTFVVAGSGVVASKTGNAREQYNRASRLVSMLLGRWNHATGRADTTLTAALHSAPDAEHRLREIIAGHETDERDTLLRRLDHFLLENDRLVPNAVRALTADKIASFGRVADESQRAAEDLLGNQIPETHLLARLARQLGAAAASAFGAGFGGSVWALVEASGASAFAERWREAYRTAAGMPASGAGVFFATPPGPAAMDFDDLP
jgi:galactokinase